MKDPTRGGVASALAEMAGKSGVGVVLEEARIPVRPAVRAACELLGVDPLQVANEGKALLRRAARAKRRRARGAPRPSAGQARAPHRALPGGARGLADPRHGIRSPSGPGGGRRAAAAHLLSARSGAHARKEKPWKRRSPRARAKRAHRTPRDRHARPAAPLQRARRGDGAEPARRGPRARARRGHRRHRDPRQRRRLLRRRRSRLRAPGRRGARSRVSAARAGRRRAGPATRRRVQADPRVPGQHHLGDPARAEAGDRGRGRRGGRGRPRPRALLRSRGGLAALAASSGPTRRRRSRGQRASPSSCRGSWASARARPGAARAAPRRRARPAHGTRQRGVARRPLRGRAAGARRGAWPRDPPPPTRAPRPCSKPPSGGDWLEQHLGDEIARARRERRQRGVRRRARAASSSARGERDARVLDRLRAARPGGGGGAPTRARRGAPHPGARRGARPASTTSCCAAAWSLAREGTPVRARGARARGRAGALGAVRAARATSSRARRCAAPAAALPRGSHRATRSCSSASRWRWAMCDVCGCGDPEVVSLPVHERILSANDRRAEHNREHFREHGRARHQPDGLAGQRQDGAARSHGAPVAPALSLAALSGDLATEHDAAAPAARRHPGPRDHHGLGLPPRRARWCTTRSITSTWNDADCLFIENVGNLVCPAIYDLGQRANVVALSVTEGEDKPLKYPVMFRAADLVVLTKIDLLPHLPDVRAEADRGRTRPRDARAAADRALRRDRRGHGRVARLARADTRRLNHMRASLALAIAFAMPASHRLRRAESLGATRGGALVECARHGLAPGCRQLLPARVPWPPLHREPARRRVHLPLGHAPADAGAARAAGALGRDPLLRAAQRLALRRSVRAELLRHLDAGAARVRRHRDRDGGVEAAQRRGRREADRRHRSPRAGHGEPARLLPAHDADHDRPRVHVRRDRARHEPPSPGRRTCCRSCSGP